MSWEAEWACVWADDVLKRILLISLHRIFCSASGHSILPLLWTVYGHKTPNLSDSFMNLTGNWCNQKNISGSQTVERENEGRIKLMLFWWWTNCLNSLFWRAKKKNTNPSSRFLFFVLLFPFHSLYYCYWFALLLNLISLLRIKLMSYVYKD